MGADIRRWLVGLFVLVCAVGCAESGIGAVAPAPGSPTRIELEQLLAAVRVVPDRPHPGGYERGCKPGQGCVFGTAWSDDHDGPGGHDGCDTRNNVLARQLVEVSFRPGTNNCVVIGGTLHDPYTGEQLSFTKADANDVQIDHVYPLAAAWDLGAAGWPLAQRVRFANDLEVNLLATAGHINQAKGDKTPAQWLPPARANHCFYAGRYLTAAARYDLPVTAADGAALQAVARTCP
ncbi:HNH endonuclease family protein [Nocardia vulneris]|uniref:Deoxyribonuclease n=1 Tax=Nocardia vulneris TaxID=1141657 RepID=A0ABR4ZDS1_9NOCA|nr:HNH endonuclease family protein [Nocardia vulneris]KIA63507.1 deoxyribonuclease [Nocardia vulneris]